MIGIELLLSAKEFDSSRSAFKLNYSNRFRRLENRLQLLASFADRSRRLLSQNCTFIAPRSGHPSDRVKWHEENRSRSRVGNPSQHHRRHKSMVLQHRRLPSGGPCGNGLVMVTCITKHGKVPRVCQNTQAK